MSLAMSKPPHAHLAHLQPADHGTDGPAQQRRASELRETIQAGVRYRQHYDTHPIDTWRRTAQLTERQLDAAEKLTRNFLAAFPERSVTPAYGSSRGGDSSPEAEVAKTQALRNYDRWMRKAPERCRFVLARMVRGEYPGVSCGLDLIRQGTDALADEMRLPRVETENGKRYEDD
jgi:hypothetical protein